MLRIAPNAPKGRVTYRENPNAKLRDPRRREVPSLATPKGVSGPLRFPRLADIQRFPRLPQKIKSHAELTEFIGEGQGFVFNNRADRKMLHRVNCESLEVMSTSKYEKLFFEDLDEATDWLDRNYGADGWIVCGRCRYLEGSKLY